MQNVVFNTAGDGYWSDVAKQVQIVDMRLGYVSDDKDFGELCVYFNTDTWNVEQDGLIYTDKLFIEQLREFLKQHGLTDDVSYSEQGMQGDNYVSLDCGKKFIDSWIKVVYKGDREKFTSDNS